jgi:hypothetical protein
VEIDDVFTNLFSTYVDLLKSDVSSGVVGWKNSH